jgi:putative ubiquitin-RnfH superfamily antitoxin RatB of RatAB toxin-antitoxin module
VTFSKYSLISTRAIHTVRVIALLALLVSNLAPLAAPLPIAAADLAGASLPSQARAPAAANVTATKTDTLPGDTDGDGRADPGDTLRYTVAVSNTGTTDSTGVVISDTLDPNTSLVAGSVRVSPLALADNYSALQNTPLVIAAPGLLANDTGTPAPTVAPVTNGATSAGGTVTIANDGSFTYTPPANYTGADSFTYTAGNSAGSDTGAVSITAEGAPLVSSTMPSSNAADVPANTNIVITFNEPVNVTGSAFTLNCPKPVAFTVTPASPATSFSLDPAIDLPIAATCIVQVVASEITDVDTLDPPDQMAADYSFSFTTADPAPAVSATTPLNGATNVAPNTNISISFSEPVNVTGTWFTINCTISGPLTTAVSGGPSNFTLTPSAPFAAGESCTVTVAAAQVADQDTVDPPDTMTADYSFTFSTDAAPVAVSDSATVTEDAAASGIDVLANDTDIDGGPISITSVTQPTNGVVAITGGGTGLTYQPNANYCNTPPGTTPDSFTYTLSPGGSTATVDVSVTCVDDSPVAVDDTATVAEDAAASAIAVLANDTDIDGGPISITSVTQPANGVVAITGGGTGLTYQPNANYCNTPPGTTPDSFTYTLSPGGASATVSITVTCVDDAPVAVDDTATVAEDAAASGIDVLANDTDIDGGPISITSVTQPANGVVAITGGGTGLTYQPNANYCNTPPGTTPDTFTYTLAPGGSAATVSISVTCVDDNPVAVDDAASVAEDAAATSIDVLANDTDADGGPISITSVTQPANGVVAITGGGTGLTYQPNANYCNTPPGTTPDTFTYTVAPGGTSATVAVTVTCVDDSPVAVNDAATVTEDAGASGINVLANDTDIDGGPISITSVTQPANGVVVITGGGTGLTYQPNANYCNTPPGTTPDTFTYTLTPGGASATVSVTVTCVDDNPVAVNDTATVTEDAAASGINVLANDTDIDGGPISITSVTQPANGVVAITGGGTGLTYQPNANYCNTPPGTTPDTFTYTLTPGGSTATVSITVTCVDDAPLAVNDAATVTEDASATSITVLANDTDIDGGPIGITAVSQPTNGVVVITGGGTGLTYQPNANYCNTPPGTTPDTFTYTLTPGGSTGVVSVAVTCVNDPPVADNDSFDFIGNTELRVDLAAASTPHTLETTPSTFGVLDGDSDPVENDPIFVSAIVGCADVTAPFVCSLAGLGTVTMQSNGRFSFLPDAGDTNASESFQYTLSDGQDTVNATVTLSRFERVWYVKNNAPAGGLGRSQDPFDTLAEAQTASLANDYIFVYFGDGTTAGQASGIALKNGQHLIGEHTGLSIPVSLNGNGSPTNLVAAAPGSRPLLDDTVAGGAEGVSATDAIPTEIVGLNLAGNVNAIDWTTTGAFAGSGTLSMRDNVIRSAANEGVDINLAGTAAVNLAFNDNNLTAVGAALDIQETGTGSLTITTFDDNVVSGNTTGSGININTATFDATPGGTFNTVSGGATVIGASGNGVGASGMVLTNVSGDLSFTDLDIFADGGAGLRVTGTGPLSGASGTRIAVGAGVGIIEATGGPAVDILSTTIDLQLSSLRSTNSATTGVSLDTVGGTFSAGVGSSIANATGTDFNINAGTANVTYNGTITDDVGQLVVVSNTTGGTKSFTGAISDGNDGDGSGISLTSNTGATISFTGGLTLSTGANAAFTATGGGTVNVTQNNTSIVNTITTSGGMGLNIANTTIGGSGVTFRSITAGTGVGSAGTGIILDSTGSSGGLTVTGTGSTSSGGTIQHKTGGDGTTSGIGIYLNNTRDVSLSWMQLNDFDNFGIRGLNVTNFTLANSTVSGTNGTNTASREGSVIFDNLVGSSSVTNVTISGSIEDNLRVENANGTLTAFNLSNCTIQNNSTISGNIGFRFASAASGATNPIMTGTVSNCTFQGNRTDSINVDASNSAVVNITLSNNTIVAGTGGNNQGNIGIDVTTAGSGTLNYTITNNRIGTDGTTERPLLNHGINIFGGNNSLISGVVKTNTIVKDNTNSGFGIRVFQQDNGAIRANIDGNAITKVGLDFGIDVTNNGSSAGASTGTVQVAVKNNNVSIAAGAINAIRVRGRRDTTTCAAISGNTATTNGGSAAMSISQANTAIYNFEIIPPPALGPLSDANAQAELGSLNAGAAGVEAFSASGSGITGVAVGSCNLVPALIAAGGEGPGAQSISQADLASVAAAALERWAASGISESERAELASVSFKLADLEPGRLGQAGATQVELDRDAAGWGWFVDATPADDAEFAAGRIGAELGADASSPAHGRMDLLTVVMHELGHVLGHDDIAAAKQPHALMTEALPTSTRRAPAAAEGRLISPSSITTTPSSVLADIGTLPAGKHVTMIFDVLIASPIPQGVSSVSNQASVSGDNFATLLTDDPATAATADRTVTALDMAKKVYLPLIMQQPAAAPDLVVSSVTLSPSKTSFTTGEQVQISVVIKNQGSAPTTPFWVDLYLNPARTPTFNLIWSQVCSLNPCYGIAWQVTQPLAPGAELTLTSTASSYAPSYTNWRDRLAAGTTDLYVQADSWNPGKTVGASGDANLSNNLFHIGSLSVTGQNTASPQPAALPVRPAAGQR